MFRIARYRRSAAAVRCRQHAATDPAIGTGRARGAQGGIDDRHGSNRAIRSCRLCPRRDCAAEHHIAANARHRLAGADQFEIPERALDIADQHRAGEPSFRDHELLLGAVPDVAEQDGLAAIHTDKVARRKHADAGDLQVGRNDATAICRSTAREMLRQHARLLIGRLDQTVTDAAMLGAFAAGCRTRRFTVAGIWRDYARTSGSVVISRQAYIAATGDGSANEGSVWLNEGAGAAQAEAALRSQFARGDSLEILTSTALRARSLQIFDRAFAITYALEAIAVIIGLAGVSFAASSTALARRAEFGMLRHVGMLRRQIVAMLAGEGILTSAFGVAYGLVLGAALSLILVYIVNRQSFNWSIDLAIPGWQLAILSLTLIAAAAITAIWSGRAATSQDAVQAVREDW